VDRSRALLMQALNTNRRVRSMSHLRQRIQAASSVEELADVLFEIEHEINKARQPHDARLRLAQARDALGLGNTSVREDLAQFGSS